MGAVPAVAVLYTIIPATWFVRGAALLVAVSATLGSSTPLLLLSNSATASAWGRLELLVTAGAGDIDTLIEPIRKIIENKK